MENISKGQISSTKLLQKGYPSFEEIEGFLQELSRKETGRVTVAAEGHSLQNRPEPAFTVWPAAGGEQPSHADEPVCHGAALRIRVPYSKAAVRDVRLNGHPLAECGEDGYEIWRARGFTFIQANLPPARTRDESFWILTCQYDPGEFRPHWESWAGRTRGEP
jgi:hypothetical protein